VERIQIKIPKNRTISTLGTEIKAIETCSNSTHGHSLPGFQIRKTLPSSCAQQKGLTIRFVSRRLSARLPTATSRRFTRDRIYMYSATNSILGLDASKRSALWLYNRDPCHMVLDGSHSWADGRGEADPQSSLVQLVALLVNWQSYCSCFLSSTGFNRKIASYYGEARGSSNEP
jgi:hypothetical protein